MLEVEIDLLTERYTASAYNDREQAEWPPHPARLFSALVSTWAEDEGTEPDAERAALEWLEAQPPPRIVASRVGRPRSVPPVFVPVNDTSTVSQPEGARAKLAEARARLREVTDVKARERAEKAVAKAKDKLANDTAKATAAGPTSKDGILSAGQLLPGGRLRQPRTFPTLVPWTPTVRFVWSTEAPAEVQSALGALCQRVVALGHSSSLVAARVKAAKAAPDDKDTYRPDPAGQKVLRVPGEGQLKRLVAAHARHRGLEPRILPAQFERYSQGPATGKADPPRSFFGEDWVVFERARGDRYSLTRSAHIAQTFRAALMEYGEDPLPEVLTGHSNNGGRLERPHIAFVPLPYVGSLYARGQILGVALVLPREVAPKVRRLVLAAVGRWEAAMSKDPEDEVPLLRLFDGRDLELHLKRVVGQARSKNLQPLTWSKASRDWATATPIALDRNPGQLQDKDPVRRQKAFTEAAATVARACTHIGLPEPELVEVVTSAVLPGSAKPRHFPPFPRSKDRPRRVLVHARIRFASSVRGPVLLGAGRYQGLGLLRPTDNAGAAL